MFNNIDELRKNGWIQTQQPKDEVYVVDNLLSCTLKIVCKYVLPYNLSIVRFPLISWFILTWLTQTDSSKRSSLTRQSSLSRQSSLGKGSVRRQKSIEEVKATEAEQRAAARQRLAAAKRAARQRMQKQKNQLDDVEIFCSPKK